MARTGRPKTGTIERHELPDGSWHWDVRATLPNGTRSRRRCFPGLDEDAAKEKARALTELAAREGGELVVPPPKKKTASPDDTFAAWAERWCVVREARGLTSVDDDRGRLKKWINPTLGPRPMREITRLDVERLVEELDAHVRAGHLAWRTAGNVWGLVSKAFDDAHNAKTLALRVLDANPAAGVRGPDRGAKVSKVYLYPSEFSALMACEGVPLRWRRLFAITTYLYLRAAEVRGLDWTDVDIEHRLVHLHRAIDDDGTETTLKGEDARRVAIEAALVPLLDAMGRAAGNVGRVIPRMPPEEDLAEKLRKWLVRAGVTRAELHAVDRTRRRLRFHDLRATGITWRAIRGDDALKIMRAAGHKGVQTTMGYVRDAEQVGASFGDVFPDFPPGLLPTESGEEPEPRGVIHDFSAIPAGIEAPCSVDLANAFARLAELAAFEVDAASAPKSATSGDGQKSRAESPTPRAALVADLARHVGELAAAGDLTAARVASEALRALLGAEGEAAVVVDLASERARRGAP